jgi:secreted Zn-dependent insulinase-like peptidase
VHAASSLQVLPSTFDGHALTITWPWPSQSEHRHRHADRYIEHLVTHACAGGLAHALQRRGWLSDRVRMFFTRTRGFWLAKVRCKCCLLLQFCSLAFWRNLV